MERWYREHRFFCDFTHCGMGKLEIAHLFDPRSGYTSYAKAEYYGKEVQNAAAASATTELATVLDAADGEAKRRKDRGVEQPPPPIECYSRA